MNGNERNEQSVEKELTAERDIQDRTEQDQSSWTDGSNETFRHADPAYQREMIAVIQRRIWAFLIDHIIWMVAALLVFWLALDVIYVREADNPFLVALQVALSVYATGMLLRDLNGGQSFGKRRLGLMVRDQQGALYRLPWYRLILRNLTIVLLPLEFLFLWFRGGRKLGDEWTGAMVMRYTPDGQAKPAQTGQAGLSAERMAGGKGKKSVKSSVKQSSDATNPAAHASESDAEQPGLLDDFRFGRFFRFCVYWSGVAGGAVGTIAFVVFTFFKPLEPQESFFNQFLKNTLFFLIQVPVILLVMGAAFAVLYFLPTRLFLKVMRNRGGNRS